MRRPLPFKNEAHQRVTHARLRGRREEICGDYEVAIARRGRATHKTCRVSLFGGRDIPRHWTAHTGLCVGDSQEMPCVSLRWSGHSKTLDCTHADLCSRRTRDAVCQCSVFDDLPIRLSRHLTASADVRFPTCATTVTAYGSITNHTQTCLAIPEVRSLRKCASVMMPCAQDKAFSGLQLLTGRFDFALSVILPSSMWDRFSRTRCVHHMWMPHSLCPAREPCHAIRFPFFVSRKHKDFEENNVKMPWKIGKALSLSCPS